MPYLIRYCFSQRFFAPARQAYKWCTDYGPKDHILMGDENADRYVKHLTENTVLITDVFHTGKGDVKKQKLVQLYPDRLSWVSTHLTGPNKYSQFIYEVSAEGKNKSRLDFTALHLEYEREKMDDKDIRVMADKFQKEDSAAWKRLADALNKDYSRGST